MMDAIWGREQFRNEIVYGSAPPLCRSDGNLRLAVSARYGILFYAGKGRYLEQAIPAALRGPIWKMRIKARFTSGAALRPSLVTTGRRLQRVSLVCRGEGLTLLI